MSIEKSAVQKVRDILAKMSNNDTFTTLTLAEAAGTNIKAVSNALKAPPRGNSARAKGAITSTKQDGIEVYVVDDNMMTIFLAQDLSSKPGALKKSSTARAAPRTKGVIYIDVLIKELTAARAKVAQAEQFLKSIPQ